MTKNQKLKTITLLSAFFFLFSASFVFAAEILPDLKIKEIGAGSQFEAGIFLNPEGEDINAIEGSLLFSQDLLELKEIRDGNSIINFWIEKPQQTGESVIFSGIIPGGYTEDKGLIFSAVFYAKKEGVASIEIRDAKTLLNDGEGTETKTETSVLKITISKKSPSVLPPEKKDIEPPESFVPEVAHDPSIFDGKWFLVFATQDKKSGIDHYEVREGKRPFVIAESLYLLQNQNLDEKIIVKAVDKSGNERVITLPPQKPKPLYKNYLFFAILIIGALLAAYIIWKFLWKRHRKQNF